MKAARHALIIAWLSCLAAVHADETAEINGKVIRVHDGDTLTLLQTASRKHLQIRLEGIDAPEIGQSFGEESRAVLDGMVYGKLVTIRPVTIDKYGRTVARVFLGTLDVNLELVRLGFAWRYDHYSQEQALGEAQQHAREQKWGLWQDRHPIPPWDWRHGHERH